MWDYGPYGSELRKNILDARWNTFVRGRDDIVGLDTTILAHRPHGLGWSCMMICRCAY